LTILNGSCNIAIDIYKFKIYDDPRLILPEYLVTRDMVDYPAHYRQFHLSTLPSGMAEVQRMKGIPR
jgi:hypothetical protein